MRRKTWNDTENAPYVAVPWVSMQVLISSTPSFQSFWPASVNSLARGGVDTDETIGSVVIAPSIREPPRKQTRWSCLSDSFHTLLIVGEATIAAAKRNAYILPSCRVGISSTVCVSPFLGPFWMRFSWMDCMASLYIFGGWRCKFNQE